MRARALLGGRGRRRRAGVAWLAAAVLLLGSDASVHGEEPAAREAPPFEREADAVEAALAAGDSAALANLGQKPRGDPWRVAEVLLQRGAVHAAAAYVAALVPSTDVEALGPYVEEKRARPDPPEVALRAKEAREAAAAGDMPGLVKATEGAQALPDGVTKSVLLYLRFEALQATRRTRDAARSAVTSSAAAEAIGHLSLAWAASDRATRDLIDVGAWGDAEDSAQRGVRVAQRRGRKADEAETLTLHAMIMLARGDAAGSLRLAEQALALAREARAPLVEVTALLNVGNARKQLGSRDAALAAQREALSIARAHDDEDGIALALTNVAILSRDGGDLRGALAAEREVLAGYERRGAAAPAAQVRMNMAVTLRALGDAEGALALLDRAEETFAALGHLPLLARVLHNRAQAARMLGRYADAKDDILRAVELGERIRHPEGVARGLAQQAELHSDLGESERAMELLARALRMSETLTDLEARFAVLSAVARVHVERGEHDEALTIWRRFLDDARVEGHVGIAATARNNLGVALDGAGRPAEAHAVFREVLAVAEGRERPADVALARANLGITALRSGRAAEAIPHLERSIAQTDLLGMRSSSAWSLRYLAEAYVAVGEDARALEVVRRTLDSLQGVFAGLGETEGAAARGIFAKAFDLAVGAAHRQGRTDDLVHVLEAGRAGALLDTLGGREAQRWVRLPPELAAALAQAQEQARVAFQDEAAARSRRDAEGVKSARQALDRARWEEAEAVARIQRDAKRQAGLLYPQPAGMERLRHALTPGDALVLIGRSTDRLLAVVLERASARAVDLGPGPRVLELADAVEWKHADADVSAAVEALRAALWAPLALPPSVRRVIVSPDPLLTHVPFAALAPTLDVALVPSGTTWLRLREAAPQRGEGVLALADPTTADARRFPPLPMAREEGKAVADRVLVGDGATVAALREALATRPRWRAIHVACHGVFHESRPHQNALVLARTPEHDGRLTTAALWSLDVPADLAVLSACETGRGPMRRAEGLLGLMSAFLYAGSPRVICSLWKVDDEATKELMTRFYVLWNPRDGTPALATAEALRRAQAHVRSQERWRHPYYWAAWTLWGLPD